MTLFVWDDCPVPSLSAGGSAFGEVRGLTFSHGYGGQSQTHFNLNSRILKFQDIPLHRRPYIVYIYIYDKNLQFRFLKWPWNKSLLGIYRYTMSTLIQDPLPNTKMKFETWMDCIAFAYIGVP